MSTTWDQILLARAGDVDSRNAIILDNLGLVKKIANRCQRDRFEDAVQDGIFGIMRAISSFDPIKSAWSSYAGLWIRRVMEERTGYREFSNTLDTNLESGTDSEIAGVRETMSINKLDNLPAKEEKDYSWLKKALDILDEREKLIVDLVYFHDATYQDCATLMNLSKPRIQQLHNRAIKKLQDLLK